MILLLYQLFVISIDRIRMKFKIKFFLEIYLLIYIIVIHK